MKKNFYLPFAILLCITLIVSYIAVSIIKNEREKKDIKLLINKTSIIHNKIAAILINNTKSSKEKVNNYIKTTLNSYLKKETNFSFYHISSLQNGMFIPHTIGKKQNSHMIMMNLNDFNENNPETSIIHKGNFTIFYKKFYFKDNPTFLFTAFRKKSYNNIYINIFSINTSLLILAFLILRTTNKEKRKRNKKNK